VLQKCKTNFLVSSSTTKETHIIYKLKTIPNKQDENIIKDTATRIYISRFR
jgi:hypothetical protein